MIGSSLSHYVVEALLGEGGMGKVYRATDTVLNRTVAIKILSETASGDGESKRRLLHEARAASALNHPNVVTIHSVEAERGLDFIVMEHVSGAPLTIPRQGLPIDLALDYGIQIAAALAAAHDAGVIHRDVKPANVMISRTGHLKVLDFGIARRTELHGNAATRQLTVDATIGSAGVIVGTVGYLSPEQIAGQPASMRSDVFSFGALLYEMLAGSPAFSGDTVWAVMDATVRNAPPPVESLRSDAARGGGRSCGGVSAGAARSGGCAERSTGRRGVDGHHVGRADYQRSVGCGRRLSQLLGCRRRLGASRPHADHGTPSGRDAPL